MRTTQDRVRVIRQLVDMLYQGDIDNAKGEWPGSAVVIVGSDGPGIVITTTLEATAVDEAIRDLSK